MKHTLSLILLIINCLAVCAVNFHHLGPEDGLCYPAVISIFQDTLGRMWFGTREGITIYDGHTMSNLESFDYNLFHRVEDGQKGKNDFTSDTLGNVFFRAGSTIIKYDIHTGAFTYFSDMNATALGGRDTAIWVHADKGLYRWDDKTGQFNHFSNTGLRKVTRLFYDSMNTLWLGTAKGLFYSTDQIHFIKKLDRVHVSSIYESRQKELWVGSQNNGLYRIDSVGVTHYHTEKNSGQGFFCNQVRQICQDKRGHIWFGTFNGLTEYFPAEDRFKMHVRNEQEGFLNHSSVYAVCQDREGTLWIGTYFGGVNYARIDREEYYFYTASEKENSLSNPVVGNMTEDKEGNIWICTEGGGLNCFNPATKSFRRFTNSIHPFYLPHTNLKTIEYDTLKQELYIGSHGGGVFTYSLQRDVFEENQEIRKNLSMKIVNNIELFGNEYIVTGKNEIVLYNPIIKSKRIVYQTSGWTLLSLLGQNNKLWIADGNHFGVVDLTRPHAVEWIELDQNQVKTAICCLYECRNGEVLVGTLGDGIWRYDNHNSRFMQLSDPTIHDRSCYKIAETPHGNYLVTGEKHLSIFSPTGKLLQRYQLGKDIPLFSFTNDCGLLVASDSTIYVGGTNGLIVLKEPIKHHSDLQEKIYFGSVELAGNKTADSYRAIPILSKKYLELNADHNRIKVRFASSLHVESFNSSDYEYTLEGFDERWYTATDVFITYTNLPVGNYVLRVRNRFARKNVQEAELILKIVPPWYFSYWACCIWLGLAFIFLYVINRELRYRRKIRFQVLRERLEKQQIQKLHEDKLNFFTHISHELKTPLTLIVAHIELIMQIKGNNPFVQHKLQKVKQQCQQLETLMVSLIDFRKFDQKEVKLQYATVSVNDFVGQIFKSFEILAQKQQIHFYFCPLEENIQMELDPQEMSKVLNNLILNALKFTPQEGFVRVVILNQESKAIEIQVTDSGVGLTEVQKKNIFKQFYHYDTKDENRFYKTGSGIGLYLAKSIVELHDGEIEVKSHPGEGTCFSVKIPVVVSESMAEQLPDIVPVGEDEYLIPSSCDSVLQEGVNNQPAASGQRILIVEDNRELLQVLIDLFKPFYQVETASNGVEGLEKARELMPDLIVSDLLMPEMNGDQMCLKIKNNIELAHIPVVLLTALNMPDDMLSGLQKGADDYICKPFTSSILLAKCANLLKQRKLLIDKYSQDKDAELTVVATNPLDKEFVEKINHILDLNSDNLVFDIDQLAKQMLMSRTAFYNKFKLLTGMTPNEYINSKKMRAAALLLRGNPELSIAEISDRLGFSTAGYFCRKFKDVYGVSPNRFRANGVTESIG